MERDEKLTNKDQFLNQKSSRTDCPEANPAKGLVLFYLLAPIIIMDLYFTVASWFIIEIRFPSSFDLLNYTLPSHRIFASIVFISPLFILLAVFRGFYGMPFTRITKIVCSIVSFSIWATIFTPFLNNEPIGQLLIYSIKKNEPIIVVGLVLFFAAMMKACNVILSYVKTRHSFKIDVISCTVLYVAYCILFKYLIWCIMIM